MDVLRYRGRWVTEADVAFNRPIKEVWGYPLGRDFRERLASVE